MVSEYASMPPASEMEMDPDIETDPENIVRLSLMKKYMPFLDHVILQLEAKKRASLNPRQAQLDKIRALRGLLLNKNKRMKMENLYKCHQVLINLRTKVDYDEEQFPSLREEFPSLRKEFPPRREEFPPLREEFPPLREEFPPLREEFPSPREEFPTPREESPDPGFAIDPPTPQEKSSDFATVRNKLNTVAKRQDDNQETLPEILRVAEVEDLFTAAGSKEPALFQRRPNKLSVSPTHRSPTHQSPTHRFPTKIKGDKASPQYSTSKRNYTRVLLSPNSSARCWSETEPPEEKLFSRRSPRRSPRRFSPSYHKKERKKASHIKESTGRKSKDFNITLNVPEDSLSTLNTKDILSRIINCKDGDVDIDSLRELRTQIISELNKIGAKDDISDLILKSYRKKEKDKNPKEVEEGELSDSESEIIENVYGSLSGNFVYKDQNEAKSTDQDKARKIQICLVINSDKKSNLNTITSVGLINKSDIPELEMYDEKRKDDTTTDNVGKKDSSSLKIDDTNQDLISIALDIKKNTSQYSSTAKESSKKVVTDFELQQLLEEGRQVITPKEPVKYPANFYKPLPDSSQPVEEANKIEDRMKTKLAQAETQKVTDIQTETTVFETPETSKDMCLIQAELEKMERPLEISLTNKSSIPKTQTNIMLSEIDILQALKNEILSESITIPGSEASTPLLHQPKINKVVSSNEILAKKRISIQNYKQKTDKEKIDSGIKFYVDDNDSRDDLMKKPSLKLTEKECERFNIQKKMSFNEESSDGDDGSDLQGSNLYIDLAPKSPDRDDSSNMGSTPPVLIPNDPVKSVPINRNVDVDMRTLPILSPNQNIAPTLFSSIAALFKNDTINATKSNAKTDQIQGQNIPLVFNPRDKRDANSSQSPTVKPDRMPRSASSNTIQSPISSAIMSLDTRLYEMTSNHQSLDVDQSNKKHAYASPFSMVNSKEKENSATKDSKIEPSGERKSRFEDIGDTSSWSSSDVSINTRYTDSLTGDKYNKGQRNDRCSIDSRDCFSYKRSECPKTPLPSFGRSDVPVTSTKTFYKTDRPMTPLPAFGRTECPTTPSHYFGRSECPPTPSQSFGRSDCPPTPSQSFGRSDCSPTPSQSFGRSDCPPAPSQSFGRSDCPLTPSQSFGRSDFPPTPSQSFGRSDCPPTPSQSFGRSDCPPTPSQSFGRSDCPPTPSQSFGRSDCPPTPSQSFGRSDCPPTPSQSFGRSDCPLTPSQSFGRSDCPPTPSQSFGRSDCPPTPSQAFGRSDFPPTPSQSFGRSDCPPTPSQSFGRSDCPLTPSQSFGRSDCPPTPMNHFGSHSFNITERPLTPTQLGLTECPPTPYYGRNECPPTPNHGFGRSDCPSTPNHPFGRSDFSAQIYGKDPRIHRKPAYESNFQLNERDRGYYKDSGYYRGSSYKSHKPFSGSDYTSQNKEPGRNNSHRYYGTEQTGRQKSKDPPRREKTPGGSLPNDYKNDRLYNSGYAEIASKRGNQREKSIGRSVRSEDKREKSAGRHIRADDTYTRSSSRGPSIRSNSTIERENRSLSVKSDAGRSFKIDTSVNATFQNFVESGKGIQEDNNLNAKGQRAASVGRALVKVSRWDQVPDGSKQNTEVTNKKDLFRRATSVGPDLVDSDEDEKSFQEIKADFKTYEDSVKESGKFDTGKIRNIDKKSKLNKDHIASSKREKVYYEKYKEEKYVQSTSKPMYSPRKSLKDLRVRKENNVKDKYEDPRARKSGIVYSNDNIVKGAILTSGYGVKNYKIPKIKRVVEEKVLETPKKEKPENNKDEKEKDKRIIIEKRKGEEEKTKDNSKDKIKVTPRLKKQDTTKEKLNESPKHKNKETPKGKIKNKIKECDTTSDSDIEKYQLQIDDTQSDTPIERRSARLSRKVKVTNTEKEAAAKTKKSKKPIISDSDSETENNVKEKLPIADKTDLGLITIPAPPTQAVSAAKKGIELKKRSAIDMHTNFGLELEMFTDTVASDPVLDNINALIADLDNDLDASKNESSNKFTNEITLENMMQNISSPHDKSSESRDEYAKVLKVGAFSETTDAKVPDNTLSDLNKVSEVNSNIGECNTDVSHRLKDTEASSSKPSTATQSIDNLLAPVKSSEGAACTQNDEVENKQNETLNTNNLHKPANEDIVSTTENKTETTPVEETSKIDERSMNSCSTPDSTINTDVLGKNNSDECVADSTNEEVHNETNVTSTDSVESKPNLSTSEMEYDLQLGNLLTMLQDKCKIKKLLSMLGDQSGDNNKIKKKLEKLSEIVSDDEIEENTKQPIKKETEMSVPTVDKKLDANQTVDEKVTKETLAQLLEDNKTKLIKDEENKLNKNEESTQLNKTDEKTQLNKNDEKTQLNKKDEKTQLNKTDDKTQLNKKDEKTQLNKTDDKTQLNKKDEKTQLNKKDEKTQLNKKDEKTQLNKKEKEPQLSKDVDQENDEDQDVDESFDSIIGEDAAEKEDANLPVTKPKSKKKTTGKKSRKGKGRWGKKATSTAAKRVTRATAAVDTVKKPKKPPRELQKLHEDIKEMFIRDDILSATGIRMCRLAKMVDEKKQEEVMKPELEAVVRLEKFKNSADKNSDNLTPVKVRKKPGPKPKPKLSISLPETEKPKYKPGPKSKTRNKKDLDPYAFETESLGDTSFEKASEEDPDSSSDSEICSLASSKSYGSNEVLSEIKKRPKRKRGRGWQDGVIKPKSKKKKQDLTLEPTLILPDCNLPAGKQMSGLPTEKQISVLPTDKQIAVVPIETIGVLSAGKTAAVRIEKQIDVLPTAKNTSVPDPKNFFIDKDYCFSKNEVFYSCRICEFVGTDIVHHYVHEHPHLEIPLSRMNRELAIDAIELCKEINLRAVSKIPSEKYVCVFCYQEFAHNSSVMETFFWHIVSMHTGEYKRTCSECSYENRCPFSLDIPPPPKENKSQLIGYICKKCNFTQLSLENLKNHVIRRHNDEQTAVYNINLSVTARKTYQHLLRNHLPEVPAIQASSSPRVTTPRINEEPSDVAESREPEAALRKPVEKSLIGSIKSKITFEGDDNVGDILDLTSEEPTIKIERVESENTDEILQDETPSIGTGEIKQPAEVYHQPVQPTQQEHQQSSLDMGAENQANQPSNDIVDYPHFKINITKTGAKEYICCINGKDNHFKTTLLISMKKHVQLKHLENWDGYCFICKVIVTPQGAQTFKDCFQHYLDKHIDNFPIYQNEVLPESAPKEVPDKEAKTTKSPAVSKPFINVRPFSDLISSAADDTPKETSSFPIIQSVVSLGAESKSLNRTYPTVRQEIKPTEGIYKYEQVQATVMLNKHQVVLETMMARNKLVKVFKCAGRFCSYTSDFAEDSVLHASTHQRLGGTDALKCSYCDFDANENAIDVVKHVFDTHGHCQYSCGQCFYRAPASQLVGAHAARVHGVAQSSAIALRTNVAINTTDGSGDMLDREVAAPFYVCQHAETGSSCKFRTYAPVKFYEHLQQKHVARHGTTSHPCFVCKVKAPSPSELIQHMKSHGLNVYQCAWCVHGADNEAELLDHVSELHPMKQPQAYLRMFTNKEGSNEVRVLPRIFLNQMKVQTVNVAPSPRENAVREVERSIDLEKLISLTMIVEPQPELSEPSSAQHPQDLTPRAVAQKVAPVASVAPGVSRAQLKTEAVGTGPSQITFTNKQTEPPAESSVTITSVPIKAEVAETPEIRLSDIVVLDSDDEDTQQPVIDLSEEQASASNTKVQAQYQKVPIEILSTCPKCQQVCKSINGLKKHFFYCYPEKWQGCKCAHCPYMATSRDKIMHHYMYDHCDRNAYQCGICRMHQSNLNMAKRHMKYVHKEKDIVVSSVVENGISSFVVNVAKKENNEPPNRKLSAGPTETINKRRFWPREVTQLPINPIFDHLVYCEICEFSTKVRLNMVRHLQLHAEQQPVAQTAPVNPVPHLETNEKHFDKMVNLASSSLVPRAPDKAGAAQHVQYVPVPAGEATRYPAHVPARLRNTCSAPGCSYTSVDEPMLKRHWEALHSGPAGSTIRCVHCPNNQTTDTSKPITASRVLQHLKMHDDCLYACSECHAYHYKRDYMEKHIMEVHPTAPLYIVRESESAAAATAASAPAATAATPATAVTASLSVAPTMDLKSWQCGFCEFKSMLRAEVVEHCSKLHQSKMQFRCGYCPYRASALDNVHNHLVHSHVGEPEDVIYYYYREGSLPDDEDGVPRWVKQRQKMGANMPEVKTEEEEPPESTPSEPLPPVNIDLKLVKTEVDEATESVESMEELCKTFGQFCGPNGINFKCPLCNVLTAETREAMQSHLYEELQYRKWGCGLCNYKAFHKAGLTEHMTTEHFRQYDHIELPIDANKEKWVLGLLDHQTPFIDRQKANFAKQKIAVEKANKPVPVVAPPAVEVVDKYSMAQLLEAFGEFGAPRNSMYCCPKCDALHKDEAAMRDHLEMELSKIRWGCTNCSVKYQTYHEAQFHCKGHDGPSSPRAIRDTTMRAAWVTTSMQVQKKILESLPATQISEPPTPEKSYTENDNNSLLVVRYEERVSPPDLVPPSRKRSAPESDDERLVIDEVGPKKKTLRLCPLCPYKCKYYNSWKEHVLKHHNLKPYSCCYCDYSCSYRQGIIGHTEKFHPKEEMMMKMTGIPPAESYILSPRKKALADEEVPKVICLFCECSIPEATADTHLHENIRPDFAKKGDVVVKCCICLVLRLDVKSVQEHFKLAHPHVPVNYALFKLHHDTRETHFCGYCEDTGFKFLRDLKTHHNAIHPTLLFKYTTVPYGSMDGNKEIRKKEEPPVQKRFARKSTTKLPGGKTIAKTIAKKSTTKLPYSVPRPSDEGYSYYGTKPEPMERHANVTTLMSFCNRMMPFTFKKLSEIINIEPLVIVNDIRAGHLQ